MGHDWVFDVLRDLKDYALANGLTGLAVKADEALQVAAEEIVPQVGLMMDQRPEGGQGH